MELKAHKTPFIIAHRGDRARYPENTLSAFAAALDLGVDMIELDVMLSRDRKVVVIHDATLERTTDGRGTVGSHTLAELKRLDAGGWFNPRFAGERLPALEEVLDLAGGRAFVNIEIKPGAYEAHRPADAIERQVVGLARKRNLTDSVLISSFERKVLEHIAGMEDPPAIALLAKYPAKEDYVALCLELRAFSFNPNCRELGYEHVKGMKEAGVRVIPYNVDSPEDYERMIRMGVDGVITSDPLMALEWNAPQGR